MAKSFLNETPELKGWEPLAQTGSADIISLSVEEYTRLKDIETRFTIIKAQMLRAEYCPIHTQIILGIEQEYAAKPLPDFRELTIPPIPPIPPLKKAEKKELNADLFPKRSADNEKI